MQTLRLPSRNNLPALRGCRLWGWGVFALLLTLSFLPPGIKHLLHTRGSLHFWAHSYLFAMVAVLFLEDVSPIRERFRVLVRLVALGCSIEYAQTHFHWQSLELADVASDVLGIGCGLLVSWFRLAPELRTPSLAGLLKARLAEPLW